MTGYKWQQDWPAIIGTNLTSFSVFMLVNLLSHPGCPFWIRLDRFPTWLGCPSPRVAPAWWLSDSACSPGRACAGPYGPQTCTTGSECSAPTAPAPPSGWCRWRPQCSRWSTCPPGWFAGTTGTSLAPYLKVPGVEAELHSLVLHLGNQVSLQTTGWLLVSGTYEQTMVVD